MSTLRCHCNAVAWCVKYNKGKVQDNVEEASLLDVVGWLQRNCISPDPPTPTSSGYMLGRAGWWKGMGKDQITEKRGKIQIK